MILDEGFEQEMMYFISITSYSNYNQMELVSNSSAQHAFIWDYAQGINSTYLNYTISCLTIDLYTVHRHDQHQCGDLGNHLFVINISLDNHRLSSSQKSNVRVLFACTTTQQIDKIILFFSV